MAATAVMAVGDSRSITIGTANKVGLVIFDGTAGQRVSVKLSGVSIGTSSCCGADVSVYDPVGGPMQYSPTSFGTSGKFLEPMELPTTGRYTILIDPQSTATGSATVTLYDVPPDISDVLYPSGRPVSSPIRPDPDRLTVAGRSDAPEAREKSPPACRAGAKHSICRRFLCCGQGFGEVPHPKGRIRRFLAEARRPSRQSFRHTAPSIE